MYSPDSNERRISEIKVSILVIFLFFVLAKLGYWLQVDFLGIDLLRQTFGGWSYVYTDWLVDYSSGFVRRGLSGELIRLFSPLVPPRIAIASLTWSIFGLLTVAYIRLIGRSLDRLTPIVLVGLLFLPSLLPFYLYDHGAFGRKETIGFLILFWHLYLLEAPGNREPIRYVRKIIPVSLIALPIHILIHEASFLLFVPVHLLISHAIIRRDRSVGPYGKILTLLLLYLPVCLSFLAILLFVRPSYEATLAICKNWELLGELGPGTCIVEDVIIRSASVPGLSALNGTYGTYLDFLRGQLCRRFIPWR